MTENSLPWPGKTTGDALGGYTDEEWSTYFNLVFVGKNRDDDGVIRNSGDGTYYPYEVRPSSPADLSLTVSPGAAFIGDGTLDKKLHWSDADVALAFAANTSGNDRIDTIMLESDYTAQTIRLAIKQGTPAVSPSAPSMTQTQGVLWQVRLKDVYVANAASALTLSEVTDYVRYADRMERLGWDGFRVINLDAATVSVGLGRIEVNDHLVINREGVVLDMATGSDWIDGASGEASSAFVHVYIDRDGNIKLHNKWPCYPRPNTDSLVFNGVVNQPTWVGTSGLGLDATTITYDGDTGEDNIVPGMFLGVLDSTDTDYSIFRGRESAAGTGTAFWSWAIITAVNTSTNQITVMSNHNIAIRDNDLLIAIQPGDLFYRLEGSTRWRYLGSIYNNSSGDLDGNTAGFFQKDIIHANYTTASSTWTEVDTANVAAPIVSFGGEAVAALFSATQAADGTLGTNYSYFDFSFDGVRQTAASNGLAMVMGRSGYGPPEQVAMHDSVGNVAPGLHRFGIFWKNQTGYTTTLYTANPYARLQTRSVRYDAH